MFTKILVANRGEIACRVIRTAQTLGIRTVAVYSDADRQALHVEMADEAVHIGGSAPADSYLQKERLIEVAQHTGAQAIHPGYGFLSENADFAALCAANGIRFIGPPASAIEAMGSKSAAKQLMETAGVPILPGYHGSDQAVETLSSAAAQVGYPVLLKAAAGGGGKGMRQVLNETEFADALAAAMREAESGFGDSVMLVEKLLLKPRHVEVQVFCDSHGNGVYLFERDCSVQRRHQKIIEEAPAPGMTDSLRKQMGDAAVTAALAINYEGAGTVEFLLADDMNFYFMEMNTRLQVEHPVTEMITGQDLVEWQLLVAAGETLPVMQKDLQLNGHAFEARIYAEDPANDFLPAAGTVTYLEIPDQSAQVRIDSGVRCFDEVGVFYDPMIAKLIVWDKDRSSALLRLRHALTQYRIRGFQTNVDFLLDLSRHQAFAAGEVHTGFIEDHRAALFDSKQPQLKNYLVAGFCYLILRNGKRHQHASGQPNPWHRSDNWRLNSPRKHQATILFEEESFAIHAEETTVESGTTSRRFRIELGTDTVIASATLNGTQLVLELDGHQQSFGVFDQGNLVSLFSDFGSFDFSVHDPMSATDVDGAIEAGFTAPMNGRVTQILANTGDRVTAGTTLIIMEAMKMEHAMNAPADGTVGEIFYAAEDLVEGGATLLEFIETPADA